MVGYGPEVADIVISVAGRGGIYPSIRHRHRALTPVVIVHGLCLFTAGKHDPAEIGIGVSVIVANAVDVIIKMRGVLAIVAVVAHGRGHTLQSLVIVITITGYVPELIGSTLQCAIQVVGTGDCMLNAIVGIGRQPG